MTTPFTPQKPRRKRRAKSGERHLLIQAILKLPIEARDVFLLTRMAGLPYEQIAEVLGIDRERVPAQLANGLVQISETLAVEEGSRCAALLWHSDVHIARKLRAVQVTFEYGVSRRPHVSLKSDWSCRLHGLKVRQPT